MRLGAIFATALALAVFQVPTTAAACPFCSAVALTFAEEMDQNDAAVIARLVGKANDKEDDHTSVFEVVDVLKGEKFLDGQKKFNALYFGKQAPGTLFLLLGTHEGKVNWGSPIALTERSAAYIRKLPTLPASGPERLAFFQEYLEDREELLARDAFDELARANYDDVKALKSRLNREKILGWIQNPDVPPTRRRGYFTLLGVCGKPEDAETIRKMLTAPTDEPRTGVDAAVACYLTLLGEKGLPFVEETYLANKKAEYTDTFSAIMALRFHGQNETIIPRERLVQSMRLLLDRPDVVDLVIPDLARWQDWESMDRLVELFKQADKKTSWVRIPVVQYLLACPLPKAKEKLAELKEIDPESVRRGSLFLPLGGAGNPGSATGTTAGGEDSQASDVGTAAGGAASR